MNFLLALPNQNLLSQQVGVIKPSRRRSKISIKLVTGVAPSNSAQDKATPPMAAKIRGPVRPARADNQRCQKVLVDAGEILSSEFN